MNPKSASFSLRRITIVILMVLSVMVKMSGSDPHANQVSFDASLKVNEGKLENGRAEFEKIRNMAVRSKLPRVGDCWKEALEYLRVSCSELDDEMQARLALAFSSCFSEMVGYPNHICDIGTPVKSCLSTLDDRGMNTFSQYFLHTQDMCYYILSEIWHIETNRAVNELQHAAIAMGKTVLEQKNVADSILESQHSSHEVQREMLKENYQMFEKVINIKTSLEEFGDHAREHRIIFGEIFEKLKRMQELVVWIQGEMSIIDLVSFYAVGLLFCYFLTTSERTQKARVWMILNISVCLFVERYVYGLISENNNMTPNEIMYWIHLYRRFVAVLTLAIFVVHLARYRDYQAINNTLLTEMRARIDNIMTYMEEHVKTLPQPIQGEVVAVATTQTQFLMTGKVDELDVSMDASETQNSTENEDSDVEENKKPERWVEFKDLFDESDESFGDENEEKPPELKETGFLQTLATRFLSPQISPSSCDNASFMEETSTPAEKEGTPEKHKYCLRDRRNLHSPNYLSSSSYTSETRKSRKGQARRHANTGYYSSDDDV